MRATLPILSLAVALVATVALAAPAHAAPKVAVVDMVQLIESHKGAGLVDDTYRKAQQDAEAEYKRQDERLQKIKMELDKLEQDDPSRPLKEKQYLTQLNTMKFNMEWAHKLAARNYVRELERLYKAMRGLIAGYARDNGIEVVLLKTDPDQPFSAQSIEDFALKSRLRVVLYAAPAADITAAVVERIPPADRKK